MYGVNQQTISDIVGGSNEILNKGIAGKGVYDYLTEERKLLSSTLNKYKFGFCNDELEQTVNKDYYEGSSDYPVIKPDFLRNKIIIPICDDNGYVVSFATRSIGKKQAWWNTPFKKGDILFSLNLARSECFKRNKIYIVEGYIDSCILYQKGLYNVCSLMGTKLTNIHVGLIARYCDNVCFCFDADVGEDGKMGAGQNAFKKAYELSTKYFNVTKIELPLIYRDNRLSSNDPDEYVLDNGIRKFIDLEKAVY